MNLSDRNCVYVYLIVGIQVEGNENNEFRK